MLSAPKLEAWTGSDHSLLAAAPLRLSPPGAAEVISCTVPVALAALVSPKESLLAVLSLAPELACMAELTARALVPPLTWLSLIADSGLSSDCSEFWVGAVLIGVLAALLIPRPTALSVLAALSKFSPRGAPAAALVLKPMVLAAKLEARLRLKSDFTPGACAAVPLGVVAEV